MKNMIKLNIQTFAEDSQEANLQNIFDRVNKVLKNVKTADVTASSSETFQELPDGYYLAELTSATMEISKNSGNPQIKWAFKTVEDGIGFNDELAKVIIPRTTGKTKFIYSSMKDEAAMERTISDALKFEGDERGVPYLDKEYFNYAETINDALELLLGKRIWLHVDTSDDGNTWTRFISWARAVKLELEQE